MDHTLSGGQFAATPNLISGSRVLAGFLVPFVWYTSPEYVLALIIWAGLSDWLDGWWARRYAVRTPLGVVLDPLADKLFVTPVLLVIAVGHGGLALWTLFLVNLGYDLDNTYRRRHEIVAALAGRYVREGKPVTWLSKGKTAVLFLFLAVATTLPWWPTLPLSYLALVPLGLVLTSWWQSRRGSLRRWFVTAA